jgi:hypothetical protein
LRMPTKIALALVAAPEADPCHHLAESHQATTEVVVPASNEAGLFELIYEVKAEAEDKAAAEVAVLIADLTRQEELLEEETEE